MADTRDTALSLFSGIGGLDIGWELATGGRVVGYCERDAYAASVLLGRMEDQAMEPAPIWCGDIQELDVAPFHGVGWVIGGFPCQDISVAGAGVGIGGERSGLWAELLRAYRDSGARFLFAENVSALAVRGLDRVLCDLAEIGADVEWLCIRASDVGASHRRERVFILSDRNREGRGRLQELGIRRAGVHDADGCGEVLANAPHRDGLGQASGQGRHAAQCEQSMGNSENGQFTRRELRQGQGLSRRTGGDVDHAPGCGPARADWASIEECGPFPPGPNGDWSTIPEWLHPAIEPGLHMLADGAAVVVDESRADQLRCCGNGVVPLQAATALVELMRRIGE